MNAIFEQKLAELGGVSPGPAGRAKAPTEEEFTTIETLYGRRFPEDFREFALSCGGSRFSQWIAFRMVEAPIYKPNQLVDHLSIFYGGGDDKHVSFKGAIDKYVKPRRVPVYFLPIGDIFDGDQVFISTSQSMGGRVYFWDHENESDPDSPEMRDCFGVQVPRNMSLIAHSFTDFILSMYVDESIS